MSESMIPMIRLTNKELCVQKAQAWIKAGETFNNVIFTYKSTMALEQFAQNCYRKKEEYQED
jgi:2-keto-3-deoxy-6-phosphogluconate aldolase